MAAWAMLDSVAGFSTAKVSPEAAGSQRPPISRPCFSPRNEVVDARVSGIAAVLLMVVDLSSYRVGLPGLSLDRSGGRPGDAFVDQVVEVEVE